MGETLKARLLTVLGSVDAGIPASRNTALRSADGLPMVVQIDHEEENLDADGGSARRRRYRTEWRPRILLMQSGKAENAGPAASAFGAALQAAVFGDAALMALTINGDSAAYLGCLTTPHPEVPGVVVTEFRFAFQTTETGVA